MAPSGLPGWWRCVWVGCFMGAFEATHATLAVRSPPTAAPMVYWMTSPTLPNETLMVAGSIQAGARHVTAELCADRSCASAVPFDAASLQAWEHSIKLTLPPKVCGPPCYLRMTAADLELVPAYDGAATTVAINAPDVWWAVSGSPAAAAAAAAATRGHATLAAALSNQPLDVDVIEGTVLRVFGRALGWSPDSTECLSAAGLPGPVATTSLALTPAFKIGSLSANCYEASFMIRAGIDGGVRPGNYPAAMISTAWGESALLNITILPAGSARAPCELDVLRGFGANLTAALEAAAAAVSADQHAQCDVLLGVHAYELPATLQLPERTRLVGAGMDATRLRFNLMAPAPPAPRHQPVCSKPILADFFTADCKARGCHTTHCPGCFLDVGVVMDAGSPAGCCAACAHNVRCNAWTFIGSVNKPGGYCTLNSCPDEPTATHKASCAMTRSSPGPANRTSGWVLGRSEAPLPPAGIMVSGSQSQVLNMSVEIATAPPETPAIWAAANATGFVARGLNITLLQANVSNAVKIESVGFELTGNTMHQAGPCLWPNYGPKSDSTPFMPSVTIYVHNARAGLLAGNTVRWRCSAFDLDVSDRVIFEGNKFICTEKGVVPHGNSISGYDWRLHPSSRFWSIARNHLSRPPFQKGAEQNWVQRETMTTDGSGAFGSALIASISASRTTVKLKWLVWSSAPVPGTTFAVLAGPGMGQSRTVVSVSAIDNGTLTLDRPLDEWVVLASANRPDAVGTATGPVSVVAIMSSFGSKAIVGNVFNWTEVVQWYGNTLRGVAADNSFTDANVKPGGNINRGSLGGVGECYHGSDPNWFTEFRGNTMVRSDGISLRDSYNVGESQCRAYGGPWVRWAVVRGNSIAGVSKAAINMTQPGGKPNCGAVTMYGTKSVANPADSTSDVVVEGNRFECPPEGNQSSVGDTLLYCAHCIAGDRI